MFAGSVILKMWYGSFTRRVLDAARSAVVRAAGGSIVVDLFTLERPQWFAASSLYRGHLRLLHFLTRLVSQARGWLASAARESGILRLFAGGPDAVAIFFLSFFLGIGITLLAGGITAGPWRLLAALAVSVLVLALVFWPRRWEIWAHSMVGRLWAILTAIED